MEAIEAARDLLVSEGPASVTLLRVAARLGVAHGNITHHFGSAANLQAAVANQVIDLLMITVRTSVLDLRAGRISERDLVDIVFEWFEETGVGRLIGWLAAQRSDHLATLYARFADLPAAIEADETDQARLLRSDLAAIICSLVVSALGETLVGSRLSAALELPGDFIRTQVAAEFAASRRRRVRSVSGSMATQEGAQV